LQLHGKSAAPSEAPTVPQTSDCYLPSEVGDSQPTNQVFDEFFAQLIDEASCFAIIGVQRCKSNTAVNVRKWVVWAEVQT
jgi:hypothetical protein